MDRNSFIGLVLIGAILIVYSIYSSPTKEEIEAAKLKRDSLEQVELQRIQEKSTENEIVSGVESEEIDSVIESHNTLADSIISIQQDQLYGEFSNATAGEEEFLKVETEELILTFSNKGGQLISTELKNFKRSDSTSLLLFEPEASEFSLNFFTNSNKNIYTDELFFETKESDVVVSGSDEKEIKYTVKTNDGQKKLSFVYHVKSEGYLVDVSVELENMNNVIDRRGDEIVLSWSMETPSQEKSIESQRNASTIYYKYVDEDPDYISETSEEKEDLVASVEWVAFKQQYFNSTLIAKESFDKYNASIETSINENGRGVKEMAAVLSLPIEHDQFEHIDMTFYFGPNHFQTLEDMEIGLESLIPLGWGIFGWVNEWLVIPIFNFLDGFNLNYGIIILLMTIFIKMLLFPVTWKTYLSSAKMKVLKPEIAEISAKHKDDPMKKQQATMALYRSAGVNPLAGCVPMLIQMPILFAMFRFFPASIELRQQSFLWADDLSTYDSIATLPFHIPMYGDHISLFTLLMAISMVFYTRINSGQMGMDAGGGASSEMMATQMKIMMYLMPIMMLVFFNSYSSGLSYYYLVANIISMGQMLAIKKYFINEDKIHKQIQLNKTKPKSAKKSKFQKRLEEMAKQRGYQAPK